MERKLNKLESFWLENLLSVNFKGKDILKNQIADSNIIFDNFLSCISIKFINNSTTEKFPFNVRVPVAMTAYQKNSAPIIFYLHVIDGFINELEVFSADSAVFGMDSVNLENIEFKIDKEVLLNE